MTTAHDVYLAEHGFDPMTVSLLQDRECWQWRLTDIDQEPEGWQFAAESRAYVVARLRQINEALSKRQRLANSQSAPKWPADPVSRREELTEIKRRLPLAEFISKTTARRFEQRGGTLWCCCPLPGHDDLSPSFHVDPRTHVWHCFGCNRGGDLFEFTRQYLGITEFHKVCDLLAEEAGIDRRSAKPVGPVPAAGSGMLAPDGSFIAISIPTQRNRSSSYGRRG